MHEYSVAAQVIREVQKTLAQAGIAACRVQAVRLRRGALCHLSAPALKVAYLLLAQGTGLEGSHLRVETVPARVRCRRCGYRGGTSSSERFPGVPCLQCPRCQGPVAVVEGRELTLAGLTVREAEAEAEAEGNYEGITPISEKTTGGDPACA